MISGAAISRPLLLVSERCRRTADLSIPEEVPCRNTEYAQYSHTSDTASIVCLTGGVLGIASGGLDERHAELCLQIMVGKKRKAGFLYACTSSKSDELDAPVQLPYIILYCPKLR